MIKISPSILASDFSKLGEEALACQNAGADMLHIDVMDGHFVPNITLGAPVVKCLRKCVSIPFDVHLMISDPIKYIPDFVNAGSDIITFHLESDSNPDSAIELISSLGAKPGISIKPSTPAEAVFPYLDKLYMVLVMTVEPGFGGQGFMEDMLPKIKTLRDECKKRGLPLLIETDGGITDKTILNTYRAGADVFVAGSYVFKADNKAEAIALLRKITDN